MSLLGVLGALGRSLEEAFSMFWDTLWALVLGFSLSGAVQGVVSRSSLKRRLGNHGPRAITRAAVYGAASSSCSYAAAATAKSLVGGGADFVTAMAYMFASTNLVVELGVVIVLLIGWQFLLGELVGGIVMIGLLGLFGGFAFRGQALDQAIARAKKTSAAHDGGGGRARGGRGSWKAVFSLAAWSDAAAYTIGDLTMLRRELLVGFLLAGLLAHLVPLDAWNAVFLHGHGAVTVIENAFVGPLVALLSSVCSVGNVPLAAALWKGGIAFSGVVSFLFADLIALPLLLVYRRLYGKAMALRMLVSFWIVMALAGLVTEAIFDRTDWHAPTRRAAALTSGAHLDATGYLDVVAVVVLAVLYVLFRNQKRLGGGESFARDPVCGMQVRLDDAPVHLELEGAVFYFCSEHCRDRFRSSPTEGPADASTTDPVCGMSVRLGDDALTAEIGGTSYYFCSPGCREQFIEASRVAGRTGSRRPRPGPES